MANNRDPSNKIGYNDKGFVIHFVHVATNKTCHFKAFLTSWEDNFKQDWNTYETVGRMDPIKTFKRTSRAINFGLSIPSYDAEDAAHNLDEVQKLIQMCYPTFNENNTTGQAINSPAEGSNAVSEQVGAAKQAELLSPQNQGGSTSSARLAETISHMISPPILRVKFANWLNDPSRDPEMTAKDATGGFGVGSGLYGTIENVKFQPELGDEGGFYGPIDLVRDKKSSPEYNVLIPKSLKLDFVFNVLHTNKLGYYANNGGLRTPDYPYNASKILDKIKKLKTIE